MPIDLYDNILSVVKKNIQRKKSEIDYHARICFVYLKGGDPRFLVDFLTSSLQLYPNDHKMLLLRGANYGFFNEYEKSFKDFENIFRLQPDNYENLYFMAFTLRLIGNKESEAIEAYEKFISKAPFDHRKIPESYRNGSMNDHDQVWSSMIDHKI